MSERVQADNAINSGLLRLGFNIAACNFIQAGREVDMGKLYDGSTLSAEERQRIDELNPDVVISDVLDLSEDVGRIQIPAEFKTMHYDREGTVPLSLGAAVGRAVAHTLHEVIQTSPGMRSLLPPRTVAIFEVNANRGFRVGFEEKSGCPGLPANWLGRVVVDTEYKGAAALADPAEQVRPIDYKGEPVSWATYDAGLTRNALRVRVRPVYPAVTPEDGSLAPDRETFLQSTGQEAEWGQSWGVIWRRQSLCRVVDFLC